MNIYATYTRLRLKQRENNLKNVIKFEFSNSKNTKDIIENNIIIASSDYYNFHKKSIPRNEIGRASCRERV